MSNLRDVPAIVVEHFGERHGNVMIAKALIDSVLWNGLLEASESVAIRINSIRVATRTSKSDADKRDKLIVDRIDLVRVVQAKPTNESIPLDIPHPLNVTNMIGFSVEAVLETLPDTYDAKALASLKEILQAGSIEMYAYSLNKDRQTEWSVVADEIFDAVCKFLVPQKPVLPNDVWAIDSYV